MHYGISHACHCVLSYLPLALLLCPGIPQLPSYMGTYQVDSPLAISPGLLSPHGPWQTLH